MTIAIYPGTFDPITNGHVDIAVRAARLFDRVIVGVFSSPKKEVMFDLEKRLFLAREVFRKYKNISVEPYDNLTVDFARKVGAGVIVRGLRVSGDFELEFEMAMMNHRLDPDLEMVCFMASPQFQFISSSIIKEVSKLKGDIKDLVPTQVVEALDEMAS